MFLFNGQSISPDSAFVDPETGVQYPANFLRLASPEERAAIGITEVPDPVPYDQRFYWGPELPKDHSQLVEQWTQQTRTTANTLLAPTDWQVIREADNGTTMPEDVKAYRQEIRSLSGLKIAAIEASADTAELVTYLTSSEYSQWQAVEILTVEEVITFSNGVTSAGFSNSSTSSGF